MYQYCPECRSEYREGFLRCADCNVALVVDLPLVAEDTLPIEEGLEVVFQSRSLAELEYLRVRLGESEIEGVLDRGQMDGMGLGISLSALRVRKKDAQRTRELVAQFVREHEKEEGGGGRGQVVDESFSLTGRNVLENIVWWGGFLLWCVVVLSWVGGDVDLKAVGLLVMPLIFQAAFRVFRPRKSSRAPNQNSSENNVAD